MATMRVGDLVTLFSPDGKIKGSARVLAIDEEKDELQLECEIPGAEAGDYFKVSSFQTEEQQCAN